MQQAYPIGLPGQPWTSTEFAQWRALQTKVRSAEEWVYQPLTTLPEGLTCIQYGQLNYPEGQYPLNAVVNQHLPDRPYVLITGGVHGYETSGVLGALEFIFHHATPWMDSVNLVICPCVNPWGFETINRWNPEAVDPNRSFLPDGKSSEAQQLSAWIHSLNAEWLLHVDLHETTNSDNEEFRPAKAAQDGTTNHNWNIPDGFYLVADEARPQLNFQQAIIHDVAKVTHIAPADEEQKLIGVPIQAPGIINYDCGPLGLCCSLTDAPLVTTTEMYPDSPTVSERECNLAQVAAINSALTWALANRHLL